MENEASAHSTIVLSASNPSCRVADAELNHGFLEEGRDLNLNLDAPPVGVDFGRKTSDHHLFRRQGDLIGFGEVDIHPMDASGKSRLPGPAYSSNSRVDSA